MPIIKRIEGATRTFGAPKDWPDDPNAVCQGLPVKDVETTEGHFMVSAWELTPDEMKKLANGETLKLWIRGTTHPVVCLSVGDLPK